MSVWQDLFISFNAHHSRPYSTVSSDQTIYAQTLLRRCSSGDGSRATGTEEWCEQINSSESREQTIHSSGERATTVAIRSIRFRYLLRAPSVRRERATRAQSKQVQRTHFFFVLSIFSSGDSVDVAREFSFFIFVCVSGGRARGATTATETAFGVAVAGVVRRAHVACTNVITVDAVIRRCRPFT